MKLTTTVATGLVALTVAGAAQASDLVERRGYKSCVNRIETNLRNQGAKISPVYFVAEDADRLTFYINASAWQEGDRQAMRSECTTSSMGYRVLALSIEPGRFVEAPKGKIRIEVAQAQ